MTREQLIEMAVEQGFSAAAVIGTIEMELAPRIRIMVLRAGIYMSLVIFHV